ncbi:MAG: adenosylcobinamide-phosphate synthase CbiB [Blautia sp.]
MAGLIALCAGFVLDLWLGDPRWLYHPVCVIGNWIGFLEKKLRKCFPETPAGEKRAGVLLVALVLLASGGIPLGILWLLYRWSFWAGLAVETFWCYQLLAGKSLRVESMRVYRAFSQGTLEDAQYAVSRIVGRDTKSLTEEGVVKATVETVAENTSDGVIAPMFYMALGGLPLMFLYKGINTMDSMVGYKNDRYLYFGRCAAKLDDAANYLPARLSGWLMVAASFLCRGEKSGASDFSGFDGKNAKKIYLRDRRNHASPNSAQTESAMAGALGIQLAGNASYFGKVYEKPTIGDPIRPVEREDIPRANRLLYATSWLGLGLLALVRGVICVLL